MASSILQSVRGSRKSNGTLHSIESTVEDQIERLRDEIDALTKLAAKSSRRHSEKVRHQAAAGYDELIGRGEDLLRDLQDGYLRGANEVRHTVRKHPVATIGAAAAFGLVLALLARR